MFPHKLSESAWQNLQKHVPGNVKHKAELRLGKTAKILFARVNLCAECAELVMRADPASPVVTIDTRCGAWEARMLR